MSERRRGLWAGGASIPIGGNESAEDGSDEAEHGTEQRARDGGGGMSEDVERASLWSQHWT